MRLTVCPLFSGSSGNSVYIACGGVRLLVDAVLAADERGREMEKE